MTCENKEPVTIDSMEVDADDTKGKEATIPVAAEVTPPPAAKNSASSKPAKRRITPIAID